MIEGGGGDRSNQGVNKTNLGEGSGGRSGEVWGVTRCVWGAAECARSVAMWRRQAAAKRKAG